MAKPPFVELGLTRDPIRIPILYEDRSVIAIDKPSGWMLIPFSWQNTDRNLQAAITSSIAAGDHWARSRNLRFLRNVHRLDGETTGVLLFAKSPGAVATYGELFESRRMNKRYLVVVKGVPKRPEWTCTAPLGTDPQEYGRMVVDRRQGKEAETHFRLLGTAGGRSLIEATPLTGRTHQIRVHLQCDGLPVMGDRLYGAEAGLSSRTGSLRDAAFPLALRAVELSYRDPFLKWPVEINAPAEAFLRAWSMPVAEVKPAEAAPPADRSDPQPAVSEAGSGKPPPREQPRGRRHQATSRRPAR